MKVTSEVEEKANVVGELPTRSRCSVFWNAGAKSELMLLRMSREIHSLISPLKKVKRGSLIYTDKFRSYDGLVSYGFKHERIDHGQKLANGKVYINGIEGLWSFAKERLLKYHGIDPGKFPLYLKELEVRYNYRNDDLFDVVIRQLKI